jgi:hypothetical protein
VLEHLDTESERRGDLVIFDKKIILAAGEHPINSITTVEFKRPGRDDYTASDNPAMQSFQLIQDIRSGSLKVKGRPISVANEKIHATSYSICDITPSLRQAMKDTDAFITPDNQVTTVSTEDTACFTRSWITTSFFEMRNSAIVYSLTS